MLAEQITTHLAEQAASKPRSGSTIPRGTMWASELGHACSFYLWARWQWPRKDQDAALAGRLAHSTAMGEVLKRRLMDAGYRIENAEEAVSRPLGEDLEIRGRIDCVLKGRDLPRTGVPAELKCYQSIEGLSNLLHFAVADRHWLQKVPAQILQYLEAKGHDIGLLILMDKGSGEIRPIEVDYKVSGWLLHDAQEVLLRAWRAFKAQVEPPTLEAPDATWCGDCDYRDRCPLIKKTAWTSTGDTTVKVSSPSLDIAAAAYLEHAKSAAMFENAKKTLRELLDTGAIWPEEGKTGRVVLLTHHILLLQRTSRGRSFQVQKGGPDAS